jgi:hypothetical protein
MPRDDEPEVGHMIGRAGSSRTSWPCHRRSSQRSWLATTMARGPVPSASSSSSHRRGRGGWWARRGAAGGAGGPPGAPAPGGGVAHGQLTDRFVEVRFPVSGRAKPAAALRPCLSERQPVSVANRASQPFEHRLLDRLGEEPRVDLPTPFSRIGPIRWPGEAVTETPSRTRRPPRLWTRSWASRAGWGTGYRPGVIDGGPAGRSLGRGPRHTSAVHTAGAAVSVSTPSASLSRRLIPISARNRSSWLTTTKAPW